MHLPSIIISPSVAITHLLSAFCSLRSCDTRYPSPPPISNASGTIAKLGNASLSYSVVFPEEDNNGPGRSGRSELVKRMEKIVFYKEDLKENEVEDVRNGTVVNIPEIGGVEGYVMSVVNGRRVHAFEGIPYAKPPIGERRFSPPEPHPGWKNGTLFQAKGTGPECIQLDYGRLKGVEDCLTLNIYTPKVPDLTNGGRRKGPGFPVILFIHGGIFIAGGGSRYGPAYLLQEDVVLITFNYRLGIMASFSTGDEKAPGNWGMKDQAMVISWVYENIEHFGGDPKKLTLMGQSAGAVSVHLQLMSPLARDKISAAIAISGTAYSHWGLHTREQGEKLSRTQARLALCPLSTGSGPLLECMRRVPAEILVANQIFSMVPSLTFPVPIIEPKNNASSTSFLTESPDEAYVNGHVAKVPAIFTVTSEESNAIIAELSARGGAGIPILNRIFDADAAILLGLKGKVSPALDEFEIILRIRKFYNKEQDRNLIAGLPFQRLLSNFITRRQFFSDVGNARFFTVPFHKAVQMHSQIAPTYAAVFNYTSQIQRAGRLGLPPKEFGVGHQDDLIFLLNSTRTPFVKRDEEGFAVTKMICNVYSNFARHHVPTYSSFEEDKSKVDSAIGTKDGHGHGVLSHYKFWEPVKDPKNFGVLHIKEEVRMIEDPYNDIAKFWESLGLSDMTKMTQL